MSVLFSVPSLFNLILFLKILVPQSRSFAFGFRQMPSMPKIAGTICFSPNRRHHSFSIWIFLAITNSGNFPMLLPSLPVQTPAPPVSRGQRSSPSPSTFHDLHSRHQQCH